MYFYTTNFEKLKKFKAKTQRVHEFADTICTGLGSRKNVADRWMGIKMDPLRP